MPALLYYVQEAKASKSHTDNYKRQIELARVKAQKSDTEISVVIDKPLRWDGVIHLFTAGFHHSQERLINFFEDDVLCKIFLLYRDRLDSYSYSKKAENQKVYKKTV